ncbi:hypothetical protein F66182_8766 [Fusarium sp. NRRL 66182]|nr:hypothetical protein F66182_8766 [Fusarium sp. NRRL 66182]
MRSAIILTAGVTLVAASYPALERLEKRDTEECASVAQEILPELTNVPTPDDSLLSFIASQTQAATVTGACVFPAVTGSLAAEYTSYVSSLSSWYGDQKDAMSSLVEACSDVPEVSAQIESVRKYATTCDEISWAGETGSSSSSGSNDDDSNDNDNNDNDNDNDNAAGINSIKAGIAVFIAGIAGVVML